jgi:hypothetical protein
MKSTRPLAKTGTDVERLLLAAGADEGPDEESVRRAAAVLGILARAALVAATLGAAQRASQASKWVSLFAWGSASVAGVAAIAIVAHMAHPVPDGAVAGARVARTAAVPDAVPVPSLPTLAGSPGPQPSLPARAADPTGAPVVAPTGAPVTAEARSPVRPLTSATPGAADRLREQAQLLDAARTLVALGDAPGALARLGAFDRRFPSGSLREEAQLLRIEALALAGDRGAASALARGFLKIYPASVHADRVAALLQEPVRPKAP